MNNTYENKKGCENVVSIGEAASKQLKLMRQVMDDPSYVQGIKTGFKKLDSAINGLKKGELILVCGRPGMGKTSFALSVVRNIYKHDLKRVLYFSPDMPTGQVANRILAMEASAGSWIDGGVPEKEEWDQLNSAMDKIKGCDFLIDDTPGISIEEIRDRLIELKKEGEIDLVIIDYLQLLSFEDPAKSRQQAINLMTKRLKRLATKMDVPIMVLSQLSRIVENREDHRPILADLREDSAIDLFADTIIFLYRDDYYYDKSDDPYSTQAIVAKNRNGHSACVAELKWNPDNVRLED